jgi:peptide/nickel transport system substrate-binding protein
LHLRHRQEDVGTLVIAAAGSPSDLDPHSAFNYQSVNAILGAYEGLIGLVGSSTDQFEGLIAESWESNEDKSIWTFHIRPGITFHDGSPVNAEAVRLSFERLLNLALGPAEVISRFVAHHQQITAPDETTVVFDLGSPQPLFESAIASTYGSPIVNANLLREHEEDGDWGHVWAQTNEEGCGSGPYRIVRFEPGNELEMEPYLGYWRGWDGNHFSRILIRTVLETEARRQLLEQGDADIVDSLTVEARDALRQHPDITTLERYVTQNRYFAMAVAGPLETVEARRAMCYAFPYREVIEGVYGGNARQPRGPIPAEIRGHDPKTFQHTTDLAQAKELLEAAGVPDGTELTVAMESGLQEPKSAAELFQVNLAEIGIGLSIEQIPLPTWLEIIYGDSPPEERPNFISWGWWPDYDDAWNHLYPQVSCEAQGSKGSNMGFYCNERVEELMAIAKDAQDDGTYFDALSQIQQIVSKEDPPAIYYVEDPWIVQFRSEVTGIIINPVNIGTYNYWAMGRKAEAL